VEPGRIAAQDVGAVIQQSLTEMYRQGRFLGGFEHSVAGSTYRDRNEGDAASFTGVEEILRDGVVVYRLVYHGGLVKD
jgi:hypothetical protein